jgi:hypothetical protein
VNIFLLIILEEPQYKNYFHNDHTVLVIIRHLKMFANLQGICVHYMQILHNLI